jgi:hypothetical protein
MRATAPRVCAVAVALVVAGGCRDGATRAVTVAAPPSAGAATVRFCTALAQRLPSSLGSLERRRTTGERVAAWGDPPVRLRCGVAPPVRDPGDTQRIDVADVAWYADEQADQVVWTTLDLLVPVEVTVPERYEGQVLAALSPALLSRET